MATVVQSPKISRNLKKDYLTCPEVIAQSISVIAPSTAPAAILGLIFVSAGNGKWLSFLLATVGLLFVCFNINQFAPAFGLSWLRLHLHCQRTRANSGGAQRMGLAPWLHGHGNVNTLRIRNFCPDAARTAWASFKCSGVICPVRHRLLLRRL
jgi:hypothetical protein